jgi:hypothetical protein
LFCPSGYQVIAKISQHCKSLLPFSPWLCPRFAAINWSPEGQPQNSRVDWGSRGGFQGTKRLLATAVPLQHPSPQAELSLATDASNSHCVIAHCVMQQKSCHHWQPLGFFPENCLTWNLVIPCLTGSC